MKRTIQLALLSAVAGVAFAGNISVCSTGFDSGTSGCGPAINSPGANTLLPDGNWYVSTNSSGTIQASLAYVTINNAYPVQNAGPWLANNANDTNGIGSGSSWVTPTSTQGTAFINQNFYYSQKFTINSTPSANANISGYWLADDYGSGIYLNGVAVGQSALPTFGGLTGPMVPFSINQGTSPGQATFTGGQNILTFGVVNDSTNHGLINGGSTPTGVRILISGATDGVPEPSTIVLMGGGLAALVMARRRKK